MQNQNNKIKVCGEAGSNIPLVFGNCPHCELGPHSLILTEFAMNGKNPDASRIFFTCIGCSKISFRNIVDVTSEEN